MLNTEYMHRILSFQLPPEAEWHDFISRFYARYNHIHDLVFTEFGPEGFVVLFFFCLFLLIIIGIYIKSIIDTFKAGQEELENPEAEPDGLFYTIENPELTLANDNEGEMLPVDSEDMVKLREEQELSTDLINASRETADYLHLEQDYIALKKKMQEHAEASQQRREQLSDKSQRKKRKGLGKPDADKPEDLVAVILNLLGHGVTEPKIAQAVYYYNKAYMSEEDVMQIIRTIYNFIGLCNAGKFDITLPNQSLPSANSAITNLAAGDTSACLVLLQALLNNQMQQAEKEDGIVRDLIYAIAAKYACLMGNIARFNDLDLAHNSFELATELSPKNVDAWNRLGDIYLQEEAKEKAMIAYQNVLDIGDEIMYAQQRANAQKQLAQYYLAQGLENKAKKLQQASADFYKNYGIDTPLSSDEEDVYQTLRSHVSDSLQKNIDNLLSARQ